MALTTVLLFGQVLFFCCTKTLAEVSKQNKEKNNAGGEREREREFQNSLFSCCHHEPEEGTSFLISRRRYLLKLNLSLFFICFLGFLIWLLFGLVDQLRFSCVSDTPNPNPIVICIFFISCKFFYIWVLFKFLSQNRERDRGLEDTHEVNRAVSS